MVIIRKFKSLITRGIRKLSRTHHRITFLPQGLPNANGLSKIPERKKISNLCNIIYFIDALVKVKVSHIETYY